MIISIVWQVTICVFDVDGLFIYKLISFVKLNFTNKFLFKKNSLNFLYMQHFFDGTKIA